MVFMIAVVVCIVLCCGVVWCVVVVWVVCGGVFVCVCVSLWSADFCVCVGCVCLRCVVCVFRLCVCVSLSLPNENRALVDCCDKVCMAVISSIIMWTKRRKACLILMV